MPQSISFCPFFFLFSPYRNNFIKFERNVVCARQGSNNLCDLIFADPELWVTKAVTRSNHIYYSLLQASGSEVLQDARAAAGDDVLPTSRPAPPS